MKKNLCKIVAIICFLLLVPSTTVFAAVEAFSATGNNLTADLSLGSTGDEVLAVQQRLTALGYNPGPSDGYYGYKTLTAVMLFQAANGLYVDGVVGSVTKNALLNSTSSQTIFPAEPAQPEQLSLGSSGQEVLAIQQQLLVLGYNPGALDGYFGTVTEAAVKEFQAANGLYVDGIVGPITNNALYSSSAVAKMDASWGAKDGDALADEDGGESDVNTIKLAFHQNTGWIARMEVMLRERETGHIKWKYSDSLSKGLKTTVSIDFDKYDIVCVGYQVWLFGWNSKYEYQSWGSTDYAKDFTLSGSGYNLDFSWK